MYTLYTTYILGYAHQWERTYYGTVTDVMSADNLRPTALITREISLWVTS